MKYTKFAGIAVIAIAIAIAAVGVAAGASYADPAVSGSAAEAPQTRPAPSVQGQVRAIGAVIGEPVAGGQPPIDSGFAYFGGQS